jgi:AcrR family transcriptional regulator
MSIAKRETATRPSKVDPRILRTRVHVLATARELLSEHQEALTFTLVADRAFVARQTLYKHWGTIENLIAETIVVARTGQASDYDGLDSRARAALFLHRLTAQIDPGMAAAIGAIIAAAAYQPAAREAFHKLDTSLYEIFVESVGPISHDSYIELIAPVMLLVVAGAPVSADLQASLASRAEALLD